MRVLRVLGLAAPLLLGSSALGQDAPPPAAPAPTPPPAPEAPAGPTEPSPAPSEPPHAESGSPGDPGADRDDVPATLDLSKLEQTESACAAEVAAALKEATLAMQPAGALAPLNAHVQPFLLQPGSPAATAVAEAQTAAATQEAATRAQGQLQKLQGQYGAATALFGKDHVLLLPVVFFGQRCGEDLGWEPFKKRDCQPLRDAAGGPDDARARGGIAGSIFLPLYGARWRKGPNDREFWPVVQTGEQGDAFAKFVERATSLAEIVGQASGMDRSVELSLKDRYETLRIAFAQMLDGQSGGGGTLTAYEVKTLRESLEQLQIQAGTYEEKVAALQGLIREFRLLNQSADDVRSRHNFLLGPIYGIPLNDTIVDDYLVGLAAEMGTRGFRATLTLGVRESYHEAPWHMVGWFAGIGLSGELTDDLINTINGASSMAGQL